MFDYKSGDYDGRLNLAFIIIAIVIALCLGVAIVVSGLLKAGPVFTT